MRGAKWIIGALVAAGAIGAGTGAAAGGSGADGRQAVEAAPGGPVFGVLRGSNELDARGRRGAGDPDGRGSASAVMDEGKLCFGLTVKNIDRPIAAHIHRGGRSRSGGVVVTLVAPTDGDPGASSGCVQVTDALARELTRTPARFYWNVHTAAYPGGAVRGQLFTMPRR